MFNFLKGHTHTSALNIFLGGQHAAIFAIKTDLYTNSTFRFQRDLLSRPASVNSEKENLWYGAQLMFRSCFLMIKKHMLSSAFGESYYYKNNKYGVKNQENRGIFGRIKTNRLLLETHASV